MKMIKSAHLIEENIISYLTNDHENYKWYTKYKGVMLPL